MAGRATRLDMGRHTGYATLGHRHQSERELPRHRDNGERRGQPTMEPGGHSGTREHIQLSTQRLGKSMGTLRNPSCRLTRAPLLSAYVTQAWMAARSDCDLGDAPGRGRPCARVRGWRLRLATRDSRRLPCRRTLRQPLPADAFRRMRALPVSLDARL